MSEDWDSKHARILEARRSASSAGLQRSRMLYKPSAVVQVITEEPLNRIDWNIYDFLLQDAQLRPDEEEHTVHIRSVGAHLRMPSGNWHRFEPALRRLNSVKVRYNVFDKDRDNGRLWDGHTHLFTGVEFDRTHNELIRYAYHKEIRKLLLMHEKTMYVALDLHAQLDFRTTAGLRLNAFYMDLLGGKRARLPRPYRLTIAELAAYLNATPNNRTFTRFHDKVLRPAHADINRHGAIYVEVVEQHRRGRSVDAISVMVTRKSHLEDVAVRKMDPLKAQLEFHCYRMGRAYVAVGNLGPVDIKVAKEGFEASDYFTETLEDLNAERKAKKLPQIQELDPRSGDYQAHQIAWMLRCGFLDHLLDDASKSFEAYKKKKGYTGGETFQLFAPA